jgi:hypothetical protein
MCDVFSLLCSCRLGLHSSGIWTGNWDGTDISEKLTFKERFVIYPEHRHTKQCHFNALLTQCLCFLYSSLRSRGYTRNYFVALGVDLLSSRVTSKNFRSVEERYESVKYNRNSGFYIRKENIWRQRQRCLLRLDK